MKVLGDVLIVLSALAVILAFAGAVGVDIWLAPTQWLLVGAVLAIWGVYVKMRD